MSTDRKTIGLTDDNKETIRLITKERQWFRDQMHAAKFAMSLAINEGIAPTNTEQAGTVWNVGSFDPDNELKELIGVLFPDYDAPYQVVESLVNAGLELIGSQLRNNPNLEIVDFMPLQQDHYE
jgi:Fe-S oxidoreductase